MYLYCIIYIYSQIGRLIMFGQRQYFVQYFDERVLSWCSEIIVQESDFKIQ